jgi:hypothetical protein
MFQPPSSDIFDELLKFRKVLSDDIAKEEDIRPTIDIFLTNIPEKEWGDFMNCLFTILGLEIKSEYTSDEMTLLFGASQEQKKAAYLKWVEIYI